MDRKYQEIKNIFESTFNCQVTKCNIVTRKAICVDFNDPQEGQWFEENMMNHPESPIKDTMIIIESPAGTESYKYSFAIKDQEKLIQQILKYNG